MKIKLALAAFFITTLLASTSANSNPAERTKPGDMNIAEIASVSP